LSRDEHLIGRHLWRGHDDGSLVLRPQVIVEDEIGAAERDRRDAQYDDL